jgi:hypothetical protein
VQQINLGAFLAGYFDRLAERGIDVPDAMDAADKVIAALEKTVGRQLTSSERVLAGLHAAIEFNVRKAAAEQPSPWTTTSGDYLASDADARQRQRWVTERAARNALRFQSALSRASEVSS